MFFGVRLGAMAVAAASAVILLAHYMSASAAADVPAAATVIKNVQTGLCLDSSGTVVTISNCTGVNSQQWFVNSDNTLKNAVTGLCLESDDNKRVDTNGCSGSSSYQRWARNSGTSGTALRSLATGFCLGVRGGNEVRTDQCDGSAYQSWSGA